MGSDERDRGSGEDQSEECRCRCPEERGSSGYSRRSGSGYRLGVRSDADRATSCVKGTTDPGTPAGGTGSERVEATTKEGEVRNLRSEEIPGPEPYGGQTIPKDLGQRGLRSEDRGWQVSSRREFTGRLRHPRSSRCGSRVGGLSEGQITTAPERTSGPVPGTKKEVCVGLGWTVVQGPEIEVL